MSYDVSFFENCGHSPAWPLIPHALIELDRDGLAFHPYQAPAWNDPCLLAIDDTGNAKGFIIYRYDQQRSSWFIMLAYVEPAYRREGIHSALFRSLVERAEKRGDILSIESGTHAKNLRAQAAFEAQGRTKVAISYEYRLRGWLDGKPHLEIQE
ncbi:Acetyltransferase (GNAT) family protein [compost metagenome]